MKRLHTTILVSATLALVAAIHQASAKDCEAGATNMAQIRECMYDEATKPLDQVYNNFLRHISGRNKDAADYLAAAEKSWEQFRGNTCNYVTSTAVDGYPDDSRLSCVVTFTATRVKMLQYYRKQFDQLNATQMHGNQ